MYDPIRQPLLVRPRPEESEGVAEYLQRLAKVNGFNTLYQMADTFGVPMGDMVASGHGKLRHVIQGMKPASSLKIQRDSRRGNYSQILSTGVLNKARVCCSCLKESDILDLNWSSPLAISCPKHRELLLDECPTCHRTIQRRASQYHCLCGQDFRELKTASSPLWEMRFYELFAPWRLHPDPEISKSAIFRAEMYTARLIDKLSEKETRHPNRLRGWIKASNHTALSDLMIDEVRLVSAVLDAVPAQKFNCGWRPIATAASKHPPAIFQLMAWSKRQLRAEKWIESLAHQKTKRDQSDSATNIAKVLNINWRTAKTLLRDPHRQYGLRQSIGASRDDSLLTCVNAWVNNTYSVADVTALTGLTGSWLEVFCKIYRTERLDSPMFSTWRFPRNTIDEFLLGIDKCLRLGAPSSKTDDGHLPLGRLPAKGRSLQREVFRLVAKGSLPLIRGNIAPHHPVEFLGCSIPASGIKELDLMRFRKINFRNLISYREGP